MKHLLLSALLLSSLHLDAAELCADNTPEGSIGSIAPALAAVQESAECPNKRKIKNLCMIIGNRMKDPSNPKPNPFLYQKYLLGAACVDTALDSEKAKKEKIQLMWKTFEKDLVCSNTKFDVVEGNIIKYAFAIKFDEFLKDVILWEVNLNKLDSSDQRTVLDYIKDNWDKNKNNELGGVYEKYYKTFRKAGAKHKSEI
jgi:hypothetical protein